MITSRLVRLLAALALVFCGALSGIASQAQEQQPAGDFKLGLVDIDRVESEYTEVKNAAGQVETMRLSLASRLKNRERHRLLSAQEIDELDKLSSLETPGDNDKKRADELVKKSNDLAAELEALRGKKDMTDQDKARLTELTEAGGKSDSAIAALEAQYQSDLQAKQKSLLDSLTDKINTTIAALAQEKGITAVIAKPFVLFGGVDLTTDLINKLNGAAK